jgi:hypothetical protein
MIDQSLITPFQSAPMIGMGDLGQVSLSSDISTWGVGEWAAVIGISYVAISLFFDLKKAGSYTGKKAKRTKRAVSKAAVGGTSKLGTVVAVGALAAAGYVGYEMYTQSQAAPTP